MCRPENRPITAAEVREKDPQALILSGGPSSVYEEGAPQLDQEIFELGLPIFGICYGFQAMVQALGGTVERTGLREYGSTRAQVSDRESTLFNGQPEDQSVWMSHGDSVTEAPEGMRVTASTSGAPVAAFEDDERRLYGVQWHPEVLHSTFGQRVLENFLHRGAGIEPSWTTGNVIEEQVERIRAQVGEGTAICGLSGGVDSAVAAALVQRAIGDRLTCVYVNHGLMRQDESEEIEKAFGAATGGARLIMVDAEGVFLEALAGVTDPEAKRKTIGRLFIDVFEAEAKKIGGAAFLAQGTLYPDVIESVSFTGGPSVTIKSHHNVGGLPDRMNMKLVEPLRELFKDEVRVLGRELGLPEVFVGRHPFPGPGLAIRCPGDITREKLDILRNADAVYIDQIRKHGLYDAIWQAFAVLLPVKTVGVMGDGRTYEYVVGLRAVTSTDGMTADFYQFDMKFLAETATRIINEVKGVNRVVYDVTSKPPGTIEWE